MAHWIRCSTIDGNQVDINLDRVNSVLKQEDGVCEVVFTTDERLYVKEDADTLWKAATT